MAALTAVVVALSIAVAVNFVLQLAIVRRLRLQRSAPPVLELPRVGMQVPVFAAQDADGRPIDDGFFKEHREAVVAFLSENCQPCQQVKSELARDPIVDPFLAFVQTAHGGTQQTMFAAELAHAGARAVLVDTGSDILGRFSVSAFPTLLRLRDGIVVASSIKLADVREPAGEPKEATHRRAGLRSSRRKEADRLVER